MRDVVLELVAVLVEDADRRVTGGVAHPADRVAVVPLRDLVELVDVLGPALAGDDAVDDPVHPAHALAAGRALAARFVVVEAQQHLEQAHHARALGDDDHTARPERGSGRGERRVVVGDRLDLRGGEHLGRDAAGDDALELRAVQHAAAVLEQELLERIAVLDLVDAGPRDVAGDRAELRAGALRRADLLEGGRAERHDHADVGERLDVVDDGGHLVEALHRQPRRAVARVAALALERRQEPRRLAAHVGSRAAVDDEVAGEVGAEDALAQIARLVGFLDRAGQAAIREVELAADVDEGVADLQRVRGDQHAFDQQVRRVLEDPAVLERSGLAFVGIRAQVVRLPVVELHDAPLAAGGEGSAAVAEDAGRRDLLGDVLRGQFREHLPQRPVAAARTVVRQRVGGRRDRERHQQLGAGHVSVRPAARRTLCAPSGGSERSERGGRSFQLIEQCVELLGAQVLVIGVVDHHHGGRAAGTEALDRRQRVAAVGRGLPRRDAELARQVVDQPLRAAHRAGHVAAGLDVPAADRLAPELRVVREHLLDLHARNAEVLDQAVDVAVGDVPAVLLDAAHARQHQRGLEALGEAGLQLLELGNQVLHRAVTPKRQCPPGRPKGTVLPLGGQRTQ